MKKKNYILAIEGLDGSGKSYVCDHLEELGIKVRRFDFTFAKHYSDITTRDIYRVFNKALNCKSNFITDRSILSSLVYSHLPIRSIKREYLPETIIFIDEDYDTICERIKYRSNKSEADLEILNKYRFKYFQRGYRNRIKDLKNHFNINIIICKNSDEAIKFVLSNLGQNLMYIFD